ncbi:putative clathrin assembly protein At1g33340 [Musa acuminata AAA Group]|uniref:putative clathrin assembly protein At1g33340 n=1 Tax=Musa acuminata AAA Group TaxID=214697 RepID=UPI0031DFE66B
MLVTAKSKLWAALGSSKARHGGRKKKLLVRIQVAVAKCTGHGDVPIEDRYVDEILFLVSNAPVSAAFLSRRISARLAATRDPVVALKTLLLLHRLLRGGDRRFERDIGTLWSSGELEMDLSWCSHSFLVSYSSFLGDRMGWIINHAGMLEPIGAPQSHEEEEAESILHMISRCQVFLDRAMDCLPHEEPSWPSQVMQSALDIILKESFRVYRSFCDGLAILGKSSGDLALGILKEACIQTPRLHEFYENCKRRNLGKILDFPSVRIITIDQVSSMRQHQNEVQENNVEESEASRSRFLWKLETKISQVWVAFDEEDSTTCVSSAGESRG